MVSSIAAFISAWNPALMRFNSVCHTANLASHLGELGGAQHDQGHQQNHEELSAPDVEHGASLQTIPSRPVGAGDVGGGDC